MKIQDLEFFLSIFNGNGCCPTDEVVLSVLIGITICHAKDEVVISACTMIVTKVMIPILSLGGRLSTFVTPGLA